MLLVQAQFFLQRYTKKRRIVPTMLSMDTWMISKGLKIVVMKNMINVSSGVEMFSVFRCFLFFDSLLLSFLMFFSLFGSFGCVFFDFFGFHDRF